MKVLTAGIFRARYVLDMYYQRVLPQERSITDRTAVEYSFLTNLKQEIMKSRMGKWTLSLLAAFSLLTACREDDDPSAQNNEKRYTLSELDNSGVSGTVTFTKVDDATTSIMIELTGTSAGNMHPAHIHSDNASSGGPIVLDFNPVDGAIGKSETLVTMLNDGVAITYEELIAFNGHVNVHKSSTELSVMIAQGNIGSNATAQTPPPDSGNGNGGY